MKRMHPDALDLAIVLTAIVFASIWTDFVSATDIRDPAQVRLFRKANPCPITNSTKGACHGWVVDHMLPLCAGGKDRPSNMRWQPVKESYVKDAEERKLCAYIKHEPHALTDTQLCWLTVTHELTMLQRVMCGGK